MKIQISYIKGEETKANAAVAALRAVLQGISLKRKDKHPPRRHIYISIPEPMKRGDEQENV